MNKTAYHEPSRDQTGLAALEWLLIVAAVAAVAALAVVTAQTVVDRTAQHVESHSARREAADLAATQITQNARGQTPTDQASADRINAHAQRRCQHIAIIYSDAISRTEYKAGKLSRSGWDPGVLPECILRLRTP